MFDVIVIGGSYSGLAATLQLARARRSVLVVDAGLRRNRFVHASHGFLGQDGQSPDAIAAKGKAEVLAYPTVTWRDGTATDVRANAGGFVVRVGGEELASKRLILATGIVDDLPPIPGLAERWGKSVFVCPYCDGYELALGRLGVIATNDAAVHYAVLVSEWAAAGGLTLFANGVVEPDAAQLAQLEARKIHIERAPVESVAGDAGNAVHLRDGTVVNVAGLFVHPRARIAAPFAEQLGCALEDGPMGPHYKTDPMKETTVPGVFACGDVALPMGSVSFAVADGARAGASAHQSLVFRA